jgi:glutamate racemase
VLRAGVFDSGVGGLTVVKSLLEHKLFGEIIYYGDTARVPYGPKDKNTIIRYSLEALEFFKNFDIDILITACNTVSAYAIEELRAQADFPVVGVIEPGVLALINKIESRDANILVIGTKATTNSQKYERLLNQHGYHHITSLATGLFVPVVEEGIYNGEIIKSIMHHYFHKLQTPDAIILGCTHFPLVSEAINRYYEEAVLIHSGESIVEYLESELDLKKDAFKETELKLFATESPENLKKVATLWL